LNFKRKQDTTMPIKGTDLDTGKSDKPSRSDGARAPANYRDPIRGKQRDEFFTIGGSQDISKKDRSRTAPHGEPEPVTKWP
jgi:hypothetical protein